jgi:two-component system phosphate regulon sensor histidine kinase PhoR
VGLRITDRGIGLQPEDRKRVFEKYYRVATGNRHDVKGFGLGLSYVKLMVEAHGGSIALNSKFGEGTEVEVILPTRGAGSDS